MAVAVLPIMVGVVMMVASASGFGCFILPVGVLLLELVVVSCLLVEGVEVLVTLLASTGLFAGES